MAEKEAAQNRKEKNRSPEEDFRGGFKTEEFLNPAERRQALKGFEEEYGDIVHYIYRCTHRIWEEKGLGVIYTHYGHNIPIYTSDGLTYGRDIVVAASSVTMAAFPDVRLIGDDVIWSGNEEDGFHTSHRISWVGHNTGHSLYGPPTGKRIYRFGIANCFVKENMIIEEWIARDELSLILQLGFDPWRQAAKMVKKAQAKGLATEIKGEIERLNGQGFPAEPPKVDEKNFSVEDFITRAFQEIWNWRLVNKVNDYYTPNYLFHGPAGRDFQGLGDLKNWMVTTMAMFQDLFVSLDHIYWHGTDESGYQACVRWTMHGTHTGPGIYGEPTGKRIRIMVISHMHIKDGKFVKEWTTFDEFVLLKQIYTPDIHGTFEDEE